MILSSGLRVVPKYGYTRSWNITTLTTTSILFVNDRTDYRNYHCLHETNYLSKAKLSHNMSLMRNTRTDTIISKTCSVHSIAKPLTPFDGSLSLLTIGSRFGIIIPNRGKKTTRKQTHVEEEDSDTDDSDNESDFKHYDEDDDFPSNFRELKAHMQTVRLDAVVSSGLSISRNQVEKYFLSNALRINGEKAEKKHTRLDVGDYIDLITEKTEEGTKVKRIRVIGIDDAKSKSGKLTVHLRAWRGNVSVGEIYHRASRRE